MHRAPAMAILALQPMLETSVSSMCLKMKSLPAVTGSVARRSWPQAPWFAAADGSERWQTAWSQTPTNCHRQNQLNAERVRLPPTVGRNNLRLAPRSIGTAGLKPKD